MATKAELIERHGIEWYEEYKTRMKTRCKERYQKDPEFRESENARHRERYHNDPEFRESHLTQSRERYHNDPEFREYYNVRTKVRYHNDLNSAGKPKDSIRLYSRRILFDKRHHSRLNGYEIHHCFGYEDPSKFIYVPKTLHNAIHQYLRDNNIDADCCHFDSIKHLINEYTGYTYISV